MRKAELRNPVWHDQFKTAVLAQAATFGLVAADTTPITNDNTDIHAKVTCLRREGRGYGRQASVNPDRVGTIATQAVADKNTSRANANKHARLVREALRPGMLGGYALSHGARALAKREGTGPNRGNG